MTPTTPADARAGEHPQRSPDDPQHAGDDGGHHYRSAGVALEHHEQHQNAAHRQERHEQVLRLVEQPVLPGQHVRSPNDHGKLGELGGLDGEE